MSITERREECGSAFLDPGDALDAASLRLDHDALVHGGREPGGALCNAQNPSLDARHHALGRR
jgi:hypothetical protein